MTPDYQRAGQMIRFFKEDTKFEYKGKPECKRWLKRVASDEGCRIGDVNIILCSDPYLLDINRKFLQHEYYTDIITFDYRENDVLSGDLFISVDCLRANSEFYGTPFDEELDRVIVHGLLHIIGYDDHTDDDRKEMREKENTSLQKRA